MIRGVLLALLLMVGVACQSDPEPRQGGPSSRPVSRSEPRDPDSSSEPGVEPAPRELARINASILVKAILYHYERDRFEDQGYRCQFQVAEVIRGELDQHTERNFTTNLGTMRGNFPWIKNQEYAGAVVFLHLDRQRGELKILGFSETATGRFFRIRRQAEAPVAFLRRLWLERGRRFVAGLPRARLKVGGAEAGFLAERLF